MLLPGGYPNNDQSTTQTWIYIAPNLATARVAMPDLSGNANQSRCH